MEPNSRSLPTDSWPLPLLQGARALVAGSFAFALFLMFTSVVLTPRSAGAQALPPQIGEIKDSRTTGTFFNNLTIELKLIGDDYTDAQAYRARVTTAVDDTGRSLIEAEKNPKGFEEAVQFGRPKTSLSLELKNPARKAAVISGLSGFIDVYRPARDPMARLVIPQILSKTKNPIDHPALKKAGVSFTVISAAERAAEQAEKMKAGSQGLAGAFGSMMMGGDNDKSLIFRVTDPNQKIVSYSLQSATGQELKTSMSSWTDEERTRYYQEAVPANAQLVIELGTEKALSSIPFSLTNIPLP